MYHAPEVLADGELRAAVWGTQTEGPPANTIAVHVGRLRNRLQGVVRIRRIRGRGYSLTLPSEPRPAPGLRSDGQRTTRKDHRVDHPIGPLP
jgi:DNA-binding winged helix-turn-helix (wHTH) protein